MPKSPSDAHPLFAVLNAIEADAGVLAYVNSLGDKGRAQLLDVATDAAETFTPTERARAVFLVGELGWRPAFEKLSTLLRDRSATVRLNALYALSKVDGARAASLLLAMVKDPKSGVSEKGHALRCLADIGDENALKYLEAWVEDLKSAELRRLARNTIEQLRLSVNRIELE